MVASASAAAAAAVLVMLLHGATAAEPAAYPAQPMAAPEVVQQQPRQGQGSAAIALSRARQMQLNHVQHPWPMCKTGAKFSPAGCIGWYYFMLLTDTFPSDVVVATSATSHTRGANRTFANAEIARLIRQFPIPVNGSLVMRMYSAMPLLLRLYHLVPPVKEVKEAVEDMALRWLSHRSWVRNTRSVQAIDGSENHDMLRKGSYLLSAQVLVGAGRGQELVPGDNLTVAKHLESWEDWFVRYFRFHARQGLQVEMSSPGYNEATLSEYLNLYDCAANQTLVTLAGSYLQLYHLDMAFEMTGSQRGGSKSRCYHGTYSDRGSAGLSYSVAWLYGWHDFSLIGQNCSALRRPECESAFGTISTNVGVAQYHATSAWKPLPIVSAIATRQQKGSVHAHGAAHDGSLPPTAAAPPLWWRSRRLGAGTSCGKTGPSEYCNCLGMRPTPHYGYRDGKPHGGGICYNLLPGLRNGTPDSDAGLLHSTYIAAGFSLASLTRDFTGSYTTLSVQNNWMGAAFTSGPDERIHLLGNGSIVDKAWTVDVYSFNAVQDRGAMIAARPPDRGTNFGDCSFNNSHAFSKQCGTFGSEIYFTHSLWARVQQVAAPLLDGLRWLCVDSTGSDPRIHGAPGAYMCVGVVRGDFHVQDTTQLPLASGGNVTTGVLVCLGDKTSPVIFQGADKTPSLSFDGFVERVKGLPVTHDPESGRTTFTSLQGATLEIRADSVEVPKIDNKTVELRPSMMPLYDAPPYLSAQPGEDVFEVHMAGHASARLDFSGPWNAEIST